MIIQVRGTSGSGKSTVMRSVMEALGPWYRQIVPGRKKPLYYIGDSAVVLGHYESPCGGCDTIGSARAVFELIKKLGTGLVDRTILCEGLLLSEDVKWSRQMEDLQVIFLTTPLEICLKRITNRRREAGNLEPLNPKNTTNRVAVIERARLNLIGLGVTCLQCSSEQAPKLIINRVRQNGQI